MDKAKRSGRLMVLGAAFLGLLNLSAGGEIQQPKDQVVCPHHGAVIHGGPRRLRVDPSGASQGALRRAQLRLGDTIELVASFDRYEPRYWPTTITGTKLADALNAQSVPGEYAIVPRAGIGVMLLMPRGAVISAVTLRTASGEVKPPLSSLRERLPVRRNLPAGSLAVPIETLLFASGTRAEVVIQLRTDNEEDRQAAGLVVELALHPDADHPELTAKNQEHSLGHAAVLFDVQDDGKLARASIYDSVDRQRARMGRDVAFLLDRRLSASTRKPQAHTPLSKQERERLDDDKANPEIVDLVTRRLEPGSKPAADSEGRR